ncbi:oxidoreductase, FAD/FMN-binding protein [Oesophagostomum dentatum]|uniref:Oxidoreductase, FAD/FMN-binding protein n=1 Tax=Oesophagostomum dentatum TaxID=61180 RepID=A0A0B1T1S2_OESDE|nr:oxidoreductase, FAD/FMN-binding protein [Oesophagostomum dentatum]
MVHERIQAQPADPSLLGTPLTFRNYRKAKNRFLKAALTERVSTWDPEDLSKRGIPTQELINIYDKWGHGGYGVILTGNVVVEPRNLESAGNVIICRENDSPHLRKLLSDLANISKQDGALIVVQLSHAGRQTPIGVNQYPYSSSDVELKSEVIKSGKPIPLALDQIKTEVIDRFVYAAKVAYETGFDGVQLHAAHGYLLSQFLSPSANKRTDRYGGSLENRVRVIRETFEATRKEIPAATGFLVGIKINSVEFQANGLTTQDAKEACSILEDCGFDFVELSGGTMEELGFHHRRESTKAREAYFLQFAEEIRPVFKKTIVYVTGGFRTVHGMVNAIESGVTDGIGLGRPTTAEPDLPLKLLKGECQSAPDTKINQDDFKMTLLASLVQMGQMGRLPKRLLSDVCEGIADLSFTDEAENFKKKIQEYLAEVAELMEAKKPIYGIIEYKNLH